MAIYQVVIFATVIQLILFAGHLFLYKTIVFSFGLENSSAIFYLRIIFGIFSIIFIIATIIVSQYSNIFSKALYVLSSSWLGFFNFLFLASILFWVAYLISIKFSLALSSQCIGAIFFIIAIIVGIYGIINANNLRMENVSINLKNLPEYWKGKKVIWVSDVHLGPVRRFEFAQEVADKIQQQNPDLVFIGGDFFDGGISDIDDFTKPFSKISTPDGIYFITGNHEEFSNDYVYLDAIKKAGIKVLNGEMVDVKGLQIIGVDWKDAENQQKYEAVLDKIILDKNLPSILLKHAPTNLQIASDKGISLQISGHTHVGQIFPWNLMVKLIYQDYSYGLRKLDGMQVYTSSGAGTWGPPMRVGNYPEIVVMKLE
jgi:hypothetical protein